jgi:hypothetical protein
MLSGLFSTSGSRSRSNPEVQIVKGKRGTGRVVRQRGESAAAMDARVAEAQRELNKDLPAPGKK